MERLLMIERIILESLEQSDKGFYELSYHAGLEKKLMLKVLSGLMQEGLVSLKDSTYRLVKPYGARPENRSDDEYDEVLRSLAKSENTSAQQIKVDGFNLKLQKVWVSKDQEGILLTLLGNLKKYLEDLEEVQEQDKTQCVKDKKIIVWGMAPYSKLVSRSIRMV